MLPIVPREFLTEELVTYISSKWRSANVRDKTAFDRITKTLLRVYVGSVTRNGVRRRPSFNPSLWSVCGLKIRSNNAAESVHVRLNRSVKRKIPLICFLKIIECEMKRTSDRIAGDCKPLSNPVEREKNTLLAHEYAKLIWGQSGSLDFLDNCSAIVQVKSRKGLLSFSPRYSVEDVNDPIHDAKDALETSCARLYHEVVPGGTMSDGEIVHHIPEWAFRPMQPVSPPVECDACDLSLVQDGARQSFLEVNERVACECLVPRNTLKTHFAHELNEAGNVRPRQAEPAVFPGSACATFITSLTNRN